MGAGRGEDEAVSDAFLPSSRILRILSLGVRSLPPLEVLYSFFLLDQILDVPSK